MGKPKKRLSMFETFLKSERKKIEIDKKNRECETSACLGNDYILNWIDKNAKWFRDEWNKSKCKGCKFVLDCGWKVRQKCKQFEIKETE